MVEATTVAFDYALDVLAEDKWIFGRSTIALETRMPFTGLKMAKKGTADIRILSPSHLELIDYKHGVGVFVSAKMNPQMLCYALAAYIMQPFKTVTMTIIQPRAFAGKVPIRKHSITAKQLLKWRDKVLIPGIKATKKRNAKLRASPSACQFCPADTRCPELIRKTARAAAKEFSDEADIDDRLWAVLNEKLIRKWLTKAKEQVFNEMIRGSTAYDQWLKLVHKIVRSKYIDDEVAPGSKVHKIVGDRMYETKVAFSMAAMQACLAEHFQDHKKARKFMKTITEKPEPGLTIALLSDKRAPQPAPIHELDEFIE